MPAGQSINKFRKVLITGLGRSGTSAISSLLFHAGYFTGDMSNNVTREDIQLRNLFRNGDYNNVSNVLEQWSSTHYRVAWKEPKLYSKTGSSILRTISQDWLLIVIFRDPVAMTQRRVVSDAVSVLEGLKTVVYNQVKLVNFVMEANRPTLLISYEKLIAYPRETVQRLLEYLDSEVDNDSFELMLNQMYSDRDAYRLHANSTGNKYRK